MNESGSGLRILLVVQELRMPPGELVAYATRKYESPPPLLRVRGFAYVELKRAMFQRLHRRTATGRGSR